MATQQGGIDITLSANADLSTYLYNVVEMKTTADQVGLAISPTSNGAIPMGVLQNKPAAAGREALVRIGGTTKVVAGAAITVGQECTFNASGRAIAVSSAHEWRIGVAMSAAAADGDEIEMKMHGPYRVSSL